MQMLGIVVCYHSFFEFLPIQLENFKKFVKTDYRVYVIDNSLTSQPPFPGVVWIKSNATGSPSHRHQTSVNTGLCQAWNQCDCFLLFDNDMLFCEEFELPRCNYYVPQKRGNWEYGWLNLMFFYKHPLLQSFDFAVCPETRERTDSGGSYGHYLRLGGVSAQIQTLPVPDYSVFGSYQKKYSLLCQEYGIGTWYDLFSISGTRVFHFRALSNWTKYPEEFQLKKKELILKSVQNTQSHVP